MIYFVFPNSKRLSTFLIIYAFLLLPTMLSIRQPDCFTLSLLFFGNFLALHFVDWNKQTSLLVTMRLFFPTCNHEAIWWNENSVNCWNQIWLKFKKNTMDQLSCSFRKDTVSTSHLLKKDPKATEHYPHKFGSYRTNKSLMRWSGLLKQGDMHSQVEAEHATCDLLKNFISSNTSFILYSWSCLTKN